MQKSEVRMQNEKLEYWLLSFLILTSYFCISFILVFALG
jgi:hypothetical protein